MRGYPWDAISVIELFALRNYMGKIRTESRRIITTTIFYSSIQPIFPLTLLQLSQLVQSTTTNPLSSDIEISCQCKPCRLGHQISDFLPAFPC